MRDFFFQIVLFLAGLVSGIIVPLLDKPIQKQIAKILSVLFIVFSLVWVGYELGVRDFSSTTTPEANNTQISTSTDSQTPIPTTATLSTSTTVETLVRSDISGRWDSPSGGFFLFTRLSPFALDYSYQELASGGSSWGDGEATFKGNVLILEGRNGPEYVNNYTGELYLDDNKLTGIITNESEDEIPVTLTGMPSPIPTPLPLDELTTASTEDISGRWDGPSNGFVIFTRLSPTSLDYTYQEHSPGGSGWGEGRAIFKGNALILEGHNGREYANNYTGELYVDNNQLRGIITNESGDEIPVILSRQ